MENDETTQDDSLETELEEVAEEVEETEEAPEEQGVDYWKAEALKNKAILDRNKNKKTEEPKEASTDSFGLEVKGYLKASGFQASEFDFVKAEMKKSGESVDTLLENDYFKNNLEKFREQATTDNAVPQGKGANSVPTDSVEYYMNKPFKDVPANMKAKVVNAQIAQESSKGVFYNS